MSFVFTYNSLTTAVINYLERTDSSLVDYIPLFISQAELRLSKEIKTLGFKRVVVGQFTADNPVYQKPNRWRQTISFNYGAAVNYPAASGVVNGEMGHTTITFSQVHNFSVGDNFTAETIYTDTLGDKFTLPEYNGTYVILSTTQFSITYDSLVTTDSPLVVLTGFAYGAQNNRTQLYPRSYEFCRSYWPDSTRVGTPLYYADYNYTNFLISPTPQVGSPFELSYYELPSALSASNQTNWLTEYAGDLLLYATLLEAEPYLKVDERIQVWQNLYDRALSALNSESMDRLTDASIDRDGGK